MCLIIWHYSNGLPAAGFPETVSVNNNVNEIPDHAAAKGDTFKDARRNLALVKTIQAKNAEE
jgi:hypothetical protein